jgi:hypothetical protein
MKGVTMDSKKQPDSERLMNDVILILLPKNYEKIACDSFKLLRRKGKSSIGIVLRFCVSLFSAFCSLKVRS